MTATKATSTPASTAPVARRGRNFLSDVVIDFGPRDLLGRLFLKADTELRAKGIELEFAPPETLMELNRQHRASWRPLVPIFDAAIGGFNASNGFVIVGRNRSGEIVLTQASRLYSLGATSLKEEAESLRLFYADPERTKGPTESCTVTCPTAARMVGRVSYTGAVWYRPDHRGDGLMQIIGRVAKAYTFTKWHTDYITTFMIEDVYSNGTARRGGYPHTEWEVMMRDTPLGSARAALIWIEAGEMIEYLERYLLRPDAQVDAVVDKGAA